MAPHPVLATPRGREVIVVAAGDVDVARLLVLAGRDDPAAEASAPGLEPWGSPGARPLVLAADGAATTVLAAGLRPDLVVGDGDSLDPRTRERLVEMGVPFRSVAAEKDESDTELCLLAALEAGAGCVTLLGAFGGPRPEHSLANVGLLADPRFDALPIRAWWQTACLQRTGQADGPGTLRVTGAPGDWLSLVPLEAAVLGVRTEGLRYPLRGEALRLGPARGLSNELLGDAAQVTTECGRLLVIHTPRPAPGDAGSETTLAMPPARSGGSHVPAAAPDSHPHPHSRSP
jgi:thiamine pyrophosphokinase